MSRTNKQIPEEKNLTELLKRDEDLDQLFSTENEYLHRLHQIVEDTIKAEQLISHNLLNPPIENLSSAQRISDKVAKFGGSWRFIISFIIVLISWIIFNIVAIGIYRFDPYPFILLNLLLSSIAAIQAPIIMMSQNRQEEKDRRRSENDYLINLKAEMQIRSLHQKIDLLLEDQIKTLFETQAKQIVLLNEIKTKLNSKTH